MSLQGGVKKRAIGQCETKKCVTILLPIIKPDDDRFSEFFTVILSSKFVTSIGKDYTTP